MTRKAEPTVQIDNERTRVVKWRLPPGGTTGYHRHQIDYVIVPLTTGKLRLIDPDGQESFSDLTSGFPYFREAGVEHEVINANDFEFVFVEIEFK